MKINKNTYLKGFGFTVLALALVRCIFPSVAGSIGTQAESAVKTDSDSVAVADSALAMLEADTLQSRFFDAKGALVKHRIYSVQNFGKAFPDMNDVQLVAAQMHGVKPVQNRTEAERRKQELVYVGSNPFFHIDKLNNSIPYLVPRASTLLQDIGRNFFDSLTIKQVPLHKIIVTSVLRTKDDVERLRGQNRNATENSCHLYGTTFDVCYNRYKTVQAPDGPVRRQVRNDTLKWILSEVLNDMRREGRCYIKYEVHQGCFHITAR